jgi:hypothetical protein
MIREKVDADLLAPVPYPEYLVAAYLLMVARMEPKEVGLSDDFVNVARKEFGELKEKLVTDWPEVAGNDFDREGIAGLLKAVGCQ